MLFSKAMEKWLENVNINNGGASLFSFKKTKRKDMNCRQGQVFDAVQTFSHSMRSLFSIVLFSLSLRRQTHTPFIDHLMLITHQSPSAINNLTGWYYDISDYSPPENKVWFIWLIHYKK